MTWTKLSDDYSDDCWMLSDAAYRLHTDGLVWSNRKLLDCRLPKEDLSRASKAVDAVGELIDTGWWTDGGEHYVIRHHAAYQRTREQVLKQQEANKKNGAQGGRPKGGSRERFTPAETESVSEWESESLTESETERDGTGSGLDLSVPATQLEPNCSAEEQQTDTRDDGRGVRNVHPPAAQPCVECQRGQVFNSGPCPRHRAAS